jgi:hypothetical protein
VAGYVAGAAIAGEIGFPLDDAWIHQTYARNLAQTGRWEYVPGQLSAGSTAPLWTLVLGLGYRLGLPFQAWAWGLGAVLLGLSAWLAGRLAGILFPATPRVGTITLLLFLTEWHLVWAAASGMESLLMISLTLMLLRWLAGGRQGNTSRWRFAIQWLGLGLLSGLLVLTRPDGLLLVGLVWGSAGLAAWAGQRDLRTVAWAGLLASVALVTVLAPYLAFNLRVSGRWWPNTLYAKQAEYSALLVRPLGDRLLQVLLPPITGCVLLLLPGALLAGSGACVALIRQWRTSVVSGRMLTRVVLLLYPLAHLVLYAARLPTTYQHGRYLFPAIPPLLILGVGGSAAWLRANHPRFWPRVMGRSLAGAWVAVSAVFLLLGGQAYGRDVQVIQGEMVAAGSWLAEHTEPGDLVAAHDIGAIGYYAGRPLLDLAGLLSPEVIPLLTDEAALSQHVLDSSAAYLVTAPGWPYRRVTGRPDVQLVYQTESRWTKAARLESSAVYRLPEPGPERVER